MIAVALLPLAIWIFLLLGRGMFWLARDRDDRNEPAEPQSWPSVTAVVPARDEADVIAQSIGSLIAQDYPGNFRVVLVDDQSSDSTADIARALTGKRASHDTQRFIASAGLDRKAMGHPPRHRAGGRDAIICG